MRAINNSVRLIGNVGQEPEVKTLESGKKVSSFSLATSQSFKNAQGHKVTKTQWHNLVVWGNLNKVVESYVQKGTGLVVEGMIEYKSWTDQDGNRKYGTEIIVDQLLLQGNSKPKDNSTIQQEGVQVSQTDNPIPKDYVQRPVESQQDDDLPF